MHTFPPGDERFFRRSWLLRVCGPYGASLPSICSSPFSGRSMTRRVSAWVLQATHMDLQWMGMEWLPSQIQFVNPFLIMLLIPLFSFGVYPCIDRVFPLTPLRKIGIGFFVTVVAFVISALIEVQIAAGLRPNVVWQLFAYLVITAAEVMVSITCLEFSYTQAPKGLKSVVMAIFLLSVSLGNAFTALVNYFIENEDGSVRLVGAEYYWFFAGVMFVASMLFIAVAQRYDGKTYLEGEAVRPGFG